MCQRLIPNPPTGPAHKTFHRGQGLCAMLPLTRPRRPWTCTVRTGLRGSEDPVAHYHAMHSCRSPSAAWWTSDHTSPTTAIAKPLTKKGPNPSVFPRPLPSASFPHASSSTLQKAPGRLVAQTLLLPDPDPSPWGGGRGASQETLPPGEACDAKPLLRRHIFQVQTTYGHSLYFTGLCCEGPAGKKEKSYHPAWKTSKILSLIFLLINDTHLKTRKNYGTCNCLLLLFPKKPTFEPSQ